MALEKGHIQEGDALSLIQRVKRVIFNEITYARTAHKADVTNDFVEKHVDTIELTSDQPDRRSEAPEV